MVSNDEILSRHKKELKSFDGEKRAALKKVKGSAGKGKKGKEALAAMEAEYNQREKEIKQRHITELQSNSEQSEDTVIRNEGKENSAVEKNTIPSATLVSKQQQNTNCNAQLPKQTKTKAQRRKEKLRAAELERERKIEEELANGGPSPRDIENGQIEAMLTPLKLAIHDIQADGHCLYRAVSHQVKGSASEYVAIRGLCAQTMAEHEEEYSPFCELDDNDADNVSSYEEYVQAVMNSARWGGQLELRALSLALKRPVYVYSTDPVMVMGEEYDEDGIDPIRVSYHRHYYALGEHYNSVIKNENS